MSHHPASKEAHISGVTTPKFARTLAIGLTVGVAGFAAFYMNLHRKQRQKDEAGHNPSYEHRLAQAAIPAHEVPTNSLTARVFEHKTTPFTAPLKEHNHNHRTIDQFLASEDATPEARRAQPAPQKAKGDGSGFVYTKRGA